METDVGYISEEFEIRIDPEECAKRAGLTYVSDSEPGIRRRRRGKGFSYIGADGKHIKDSATRERIKSLVIPPAWTEVWIAPDPDGHIQATGRDALGRKQYIYHPEWESVRNEMKFNRTIAFGESLSSIREQCEKDLRRKGLPYEKVVGAVIYLLDRTLIRVGNKSYAKANESFGLTTLRDRHVDFTGTRCTFAFNGKSGKQHTIELDDARLARIVRRCRDVPGYDLFQYYDENDRPRAIESSDVNAYLQQVTGRDFTAKDFRTWGGSVQAAVYLSQLSDAETEKEKDKQVVEMVKSVAERLGNTPAVCRGYYIHPAIIEAHQDGTLREIFEAGLEHNPLPHLDPEEMALLHFFSTRC